MSLTAPGCVSNSAVTAEMKQPPGKTRRSMWERNAFVQRAHVLERIRDSGRGLDDVRVEDLPGGVHGRELQLFLGAEVRVEAALAHPDVGGEVADGDALEAVDRGEVRGRAQDRLAAALAVRARPALGRGRVHG